MKTKKEIYEELLKEYEVLESLKPSDVGLKYDSDKLLVTLVQPEFIEGIAEVLTFGAKKYKPNSWQTVPDGKRRYKDALYRHWLAYLKGEEYDLESGLSHLKHIACNAMFLLHLNKER